MLAERLQPGVVAHFRRHTALHLKSSLISPFSVKKKTSARARGRPKLPQAPSALSQEAEAAAGSDART